MNKARKLVPKRSEDAILLARFVSQNDEIAFARIVRKYEELVWNICCRVLHHRHDAEDAFQQTYLLLASKARRIRKPNSLSSWLYGVAFRTASRIRRQRQRDMLPYETTADPGLTDDVLAHVARKNENELVSAEIMLMQEKHKKPLLMFYFMGDSTREIARTLGITVSAVEGRLRQARQTLRTQLRLRGVDFDTTCASLVAPIIGMNPALTSATINQVVTASAASLAGKLTKFITSLNQTGAKLMLSKLAVSFSIFCVASLGALHHGGTFQDDDPSVTEVRNESQKPQAELPIKFLTQDKNPEGKSSLTEHLVTFHDHVYGIWRDTFVGPQQVETEGDVIIVSRWEVADAQTSTFQLKMEDGNEADAESTSNFLGKIRILNDENQENVFAFEVPNAEEPATETVVEVRWTEARGQEMPFLYKIPYIGRLFKNSGAVKPDAELWPTQPRFQLDLSLEPETLDEENEK